ncbi:MAG TPA: SUMF1/EgtB/PvdO family nonheme iron enzyme [Anaerolineaceae bacterium]|nr:SUMF1/EgtB/PvdO family nonheme iron enzyme [Anaerolineaceae bacterium]
MKRDQIQFLSVVFLLMVCACSVTVGGMGDQAQTPPVTTPTLELQLPLKVWIFPEVPAPLQKRFVLPENMAWAENPAVASIFYGLAQNVPVGQAVIAQAEWNYVLVAPRWSAREGVFAEDLSALWQGKPRGSLRQIEKLLIYAEDYNSLSALLGEEGDEGALGEIVHLIPNSQESLAEELGASVWAIVPLSRVNEDYKVLRINEVSPLDADFAEKSYILQGIYALYMDPAVLAWMGEQSVNVLLDAFVGKAPENLPEAPLEVTSPTPSETMEPSEGLQIEENERLREVDGAVEVLIPAGEFFFGCDPQHNGGFECLPDELPLQRLYLEMFAIDKFEVTNVQYARCVAAGACEEPVYTYSATRESYYDNPAYANYPVSGISWNEAYAYCTWVGGRLPTEAEWEKAARGETMRAYPWGDEEPNCNLANSRDDRMGACVGDTAPVGSYPLGASPYGVMDMAGNVWEWMMDYYAVGLDGTRENIDPTTVSLDYPRTVKGGAWDYSWSWMRIAYNSDHGPDEHKISFGFRCMRPMD